MKYCTKCGKALPDDAGFCSACGAPQAPKTWDDDPEEAESPEERSNGSDSADAGFYHDGRSASPAPALSAADREKRDMIFQAISRQELRKRNNLAYFIAGAAVFVIMLIISAATGFSALVMLIAAGVCALFAVPGFIGWQSADSRIAELRRELWRLEGKPPLEK